MSLVGFLADRYDFEGDETQIINAVVYKFDSETGNERVEPAILKHIAPAPSLLFEGSLIPTSRAIEQVPFVHTTINRRQIVTLALILPHNRDSLLAVQCGIVWAKLADLPPFTFVLNISLRQTRQTSQILANGQSIKVLRILEVFLRQIRNTKDEKHLFIGSSACTTRRLRSQRGLTLKNMSLQKDSCWIVAQTQVKFIEFLVMYKTKKWRRSPKVDVGRLAPGIQRLNHELSLIMSFEHTSSRDSRYSCSAVPILAGHAVQSSRRWI